MSRRRAGNDFLKQIKRTREAARTLEPEQKASEPEWTPETPEVAVEFYKGQRDELRAEVEREREARQAAERRAASREAERSRPASFGRIFKRGRPYWR